MLEGNILKAVKKGLTKRNGCDRIEELPLKRFGVNVESTLKIED